jgi:hypothetical protein
LKTSRKKDQITISKCVMSLSNTDEANETIHFCTTCRPKGLLKKDHEKTKHDIAEAGFVSGPLAPVPPI